MYTLNRFDGKKVLITGGLGFIGSNLAHKLFELGAKVFIYDACLDPYGWNFKNIKEIKDKLKFIKGDIRNFELMKKVVRNKDYIFDCASQVSHLISVKNPFLDIDINCRGAITVLEAVRYVNKETKLIYAGTRGSIGKMEYSPVDEKHPTNPFDMNGIDKLSAEKYHMLYNRVYGIRTTSIRINNTYGERAQVKHDDYGVINWFIRRAILNEEIVIHGDGSQTRDYNYVEDVVDAMILASKSEKSNGEVFMLGSGREMSLLNMIKLILKIAGSKAKIKKIDRPCERKAIEIGNFVVNFDRIKNVLNWYPKTSLEEGLKKTIDFYRKNINNYI